MLLVSPCSTLITRCAVFLVLVSTAILLAAPEPPPDPIPANCPCPPSSVPITCIMGANVTRCFDFSDPDPCECVSGLCNPPLAIYGVGLEWYLLGNLIDYESPVCSESGCSGSCFEYLSYECSDAYICVHPIQGNPQNRTCVTSFDCGNIYWGSSSSENWYKRDTPCCVSAY